MTVRTLVVALAAFALPALAQDDPVKARVKKIDPHAAHDQQPTGKKAEKKPAAEARVSPEAQAELKLIKEAYAKLNALELAGTYIAEFDVNGTVENQKSSFTAGFLAPNQFRHEMKGDVLIGSTGEKFYAYRPARNDYKLTDAPKSRGPSSSLPEPVKSLLEMQNPALMCAVVDDAARFLVEDTLEVARIADKSFDNKPHVMLHFKGEKLSYEVAVDPETHLIRNVAADMRKMMEAQGLPSVNKARLVMDYTTVSTSAQPKAEAFAWAAPQGAKDAGAEAVEVGDANALVGKDAPDWTLPGMDGKPVAMKDLKGQVIVLDFWATWCGPCRASLPGLNKVHKELSPKGLATFAIDLEEPKEKVQPVAQQLCPDIPILFDEKSEVAKSYGVSGIPHTVVIGKDGKLKKVFIGSGNEAKIRAAVEKELGV